MFPQFGATAESLSKVSTLALRVGSDAHIYDDPEDVNITLLLNSKFETEKSEGLKRLLALIAQGFDVSCFFPQVVKNVASQSVEVKKLVYMYLLHYAEKCPNEALLSINCFQKDLSDPNPLVRAWALRAITGIHIHAIAPLVLVAVTKCSRDPAPYVRKCAAYALPKIFALQQAENSSSLEELVGLLLNDSSPMVIGAAAAAFDSICYTSMQFIGKIFHRLCEALPDVEEWGQIVLIDILLRYVVARHGFVRDSLLCSSSIFHASPYEEELAGNSVSSLSGKTNDKEYNASFITLLLKCYLMGTSEYLSYCNHTCGKSTEFDSAVLTSSHNTDIRILLQCTSPLLWSRNSAVVLGAASVHWIMAPEDDVNKIVKPLLFILRSSAFSKHVVLGNVKVFVKAMPSLFAPYFEDFYISSSDSYQVKILKLEILSIIVVGSSVHSIFQEFQDYIRDPDRRFAAETVAVIGICAQKLPVMAHTCLDFLLSLVRQECSISGADAHVGAGVLMHAIKAIKAIIKENSASYEKVIIQLGRCLDFVKVPEGRAMIIWIMGEYNFVGCNISLVIPSLFRYLAGCFPREDSETKIQILIACMKVVLRVNENSSSVYQKILQYIIEMGNYDLNYVVRDHARFIKKLLAFHLLLLQDNSGPMPAPDMKKEIVGCVFNQTSRLKTDGGRSMRVYLPGSLSLLVLHAAPGYRPLPKPCSLKSGELIHSAPAEFLEQGSTSSSSETDDSIVLSESNSDYDSHGTSKLNSDRRDTFSHHSMDIYPLIDDSDGSNGNGISACNDSMSFPAMRGIISNQFLESWLDEQPAVTGHDSSVEGVVSQSFTRILVRDVDVSVMPKTCMLLAPSSDHGLKVTYFFSSEASTVLPSYVCVVIHFENCSREKLMEVSVGDDESCSSTRLTPDVLQSFKKPDGIPRIIPSEVVEYLEPGQKAERLIQVHFDHHLLPVKIYVSCNGKSYPVKLWPNIGYFVKPLCMDFALFRNKESHLRGMFENTRRCVFSGHIEEIRHYEGLNIAIRDMLLMVCRKLVSRILSNSNIFLVAVDEPVAQQISDASGLCMHFSGEILSSSLPCLLTLNVVAGKCSEPLNLNVKVNCEDTMFGLNFLNKIVSFIE